MPYSTLKRITFRLYKEVKYPIMAIRKAQMVRVYRLLFKDLGKYGKLNRLCFSVDPHMKRKATCFAEAVEGFWADKQGVPPDNLYLKFDGSSRYYHFATWYRKHRCDGTEGLNWL